MDGPARALVAADILANHDEQGEQAFLVPWRLKQPGDVLQRHVAVSRAPARAVEER